MSSDKSATPIGDDEVTIEMARYEVGRMAESKLEDWLNEDGEYSPEAFEQVCGLMWEVIADLKCGDAG